MLMKFFEQFDIFRSHATFRTRGQPEIKNACSGVLSFLLFLLFIYLFISQFIQVTAWQRIQATETQTTVLDSTREIKNFMVAFGVEGFRIEGITEFLKLELKEIVNNGTKVLSERILNTEKCKYEHWPELGDQIDENFVSYNMANKLCLTPGQNFSIQRPENGIYHTLKVEVNACKRMYKNRTAMYENCADDNLTESRNTYWIEENKYFIVTVVYLSSALNPLKKEPIESILKRERLTFTISQGSEVFVYLNTYTIKTDHSILPYEDNTEQKGYQFDYSERGFYEIVWFFEHSSCTFGLSNTEIVIERNAGKADEILSYTGGLFGIIISFLSFFLMSFNEYRYELRAAEISFDYNDDGKRIRENDFTFFFYLKYVTYDWIRTLFCYEIKSWSDCKEVDETRNEATNQLDVALMFKKMQYFERFMEIIVGEKEKIGIFVTQPPSLTEVKKNRMYIEYYDKVIMGENAITIEDINTVVGIFHLAQSFNLLNKSEESLNANGNDDEFFERDNVLDFAIQRYDEHFSQEGSVPNLSDEELKVEREISKAFYSIPDTLRKRIQKKIPLKILSRLKKIKIEEEKLEKNMMETEMMLTNST